MENRTTHGRPFEWVVLALGIVVVATVACVSPLPVTDAPLIVIDGRFEDWEAIPIAVRDPVDPRAVLCDFRDLRYASDAQALFLDARFENPVLIPVVRGTVLFLIDADGDPTSGWEERGLSGVDLVVQGRVDRSRNPGERQASALRVWPPDQAPPADAVPMSLTRADVMRAPAYQADRFEIRLPRGMVLPATRTPLLTGPRARIKIVAVLRDGSVVDEVGPVDLDLVPFGPGPNLVDRGDPLARTAGSRLRVVEWNVSHRTLARREDQVATILAALRPDLLLLNEVSESLSAEQVGRILDRAGLRSDSGSLDIVYGHGGGAERAVVAGSRPLTEVVELSDLDYPLLDPRSFFQRLDPSPRGLPDFSEGVQVVGAMAEIEDQRLLLVAFGLGSRGSRPFGSEEYIRRIEAMTIASAIARAEAESPFDMVIVAGDFNLVVTAQPLVTLAGKAHRAPEPLEVVEALQLDGRSNETWSNPDERFAAGRLDFMLYSSDALELDRAFVFDSRDLSERWLDHHGLERGISSEASDHFPIVADFSW